MKKFYSLAVALTAMFAMTSCVSEDQDLVKNGQEAGKGYIALNLTNDEELTTRATVNVADASSWYASVKQGETEKFAKALVSGLASQSFGEGDGYTVTASNYSDLAAALADNTGDSFGKAYYEGTSESFSVSAGNTATATIACGKAQNAKLTINTAAFTNITLTSFTVSGSDGGNGTRNVVFHDGETDNTSKAAFFKAADNLTYTIKYKAANNEEKTITNSTPIQLGAHTANTLSLASNSTGLITLSISYDDELDEGQTVSYTIDAATGNQVANP